MGSARGVDFFRSANGKRILLNEIRGDLTADQFALLKRNVDRLERHGWDLDGSYFDRGKGVGEAMYEFRMSLPDIEYRILFAEEPGQIFRALVAYREVRNSIPAAKKTAAVRRLQEWRKRRV